MKACDALAFEAGEGLDFLLELAGDTQ